MNAATRIICIALGIACLAMAIVLQHKPAQIRLVTRAPTDVPAAPPADTAEIEPGCFNVRALAERLGVNAPWLIANQPPIGKTPFQNSAEQIREIVLRSVAVDWGERHGDSAATNLIGEVLVFRRTPHDLASIRVLLDGLDRANSTPRISIRLPAKPGAQSNVETTVTIIDVRPLLANLQFAEGPNFNSFQADRTLDNIERLIRRTIGQSLYVEDQEAIADACGGLLVLRVTPDHLKSIDGILHTLDSVRTAGDLSPAMVIPEISESSLADILPMALFNVRPQLLNFQSAGLITPANYQLRVYLTAHVDPESWGPVGEGDMVWFGSVVGIKQTPENIRAVQHALEEMASKIPSTPK